MKIYKKCSAALSGAAGQKNRFLRQIENGFWIKNPKVNEHFVSLNIRYHSLAAGVKTLAKNLAKKL